MTKNESGISVVDNAERRYLTKGQVCEMLGVSTRCLEGWMRRGHVPYFKIGRWVRFLEDDIHRHLQNYRIDRCKNYSPSRRSAKLKLAAERNAAN